MTHETRQEALKCFEDALESALGRALERLFPTESNADVVRHHLRAVLNGTMLRTLEKAGKPRELPEDERLALLIEYLKSHPDYLPAGSLPLTSDAAESDEDDPHLITQVHEELRRVLSELLPSSFPGLQIRVIPSNQD